MKYRLLPASAYCVFSGAGVIMPAGIPDDPAAVIVIRRPALIKGLTWLSRDRTANRFRRVYRDNFITRWNFYLITAGAKSCGVLREKLLSRAPEHAIYKA